MEYRFTLGRKPIGSNLVTNGTFDTDLNGWLCGGGACPAANWIWHASGTARYVGNNRGDILSQANIFTVGKTYRISYDIYNSGFPLGSQVGMFVGDYGKSYDAASNAWQTITYDKPCLKGTSLQFKPSAIIGTNINLDNISVYELGWETPLTDEPIGWDKAKIKVERDKEMNGLLTKYINDLTFWGDGYAYLLAQYNSGICNEVPVLIESRCESTDTWVEFYEGMIYVSDIKWDFAKCQCSVDIEDKSAGTLILKGKDVKVSPTVYNCWSGVGILVDSLQLTNIHDIQNGVWFQEQVPLYNVGKLFRRIIHNATDVQVEFESIFFETGIYEYLALGQGWEIRNTFDFPVNPNPVFSSGDEVSTWSFDELFTEMNKIFDLSFQIYYPSGVPTIKIEPKYFFYSGIVAITLNDVPNLKKELDKDLMYRTCKIGYEKYSTGIFNPIAPYTELVENKGYSYEIDGSCFNKKIDLVSEYIQDSCLIWNICKWITPGFPSVITDYDKDIFIIECYDNIGTLESRQYLVGALQLFNGRIDYNDNMQRWVWSMPADAILQTSTRTVVAKGNLPALINLWEFDYPISETDFNLIMADMTKEIAFNSVADGISEVGYIQNMERDNKTGLTHFKILTS